MCFAIVVVVNVVVCLYVCGVFVCFEELCLFIA